jgi:hypothetical protein
LATARYWIIDDRHVKILHLAKDILLACVWCEAVERAHPSGLDAASHLWSHVAR